MWDTEEVKAKPESSVLPCLGNARSPVRTSVFALNRLKVTDETHPYLLALESKNQ